MIRHVPRYGLLIGCFLPLRFRTPGAYGFAAVRRNVANALANRVLFC
jgi:hypothetical protein